MTQLQLNAEKYLQMKIEIDNLQKASDILLEKIKADMNTRNVQSVTVSRGKVFQYASMILSEYSHKEDNCYVCDGSGIIQAEHCPHCNGSGKHNMLTENENT
jgi:RecJ-like exonuclease